MGTCIIPIDYFAVPPKLRVQGDEKAKSLSGFLATLVLAGVIIWAVVNAIVQIAGRRDPTSNISEVYVDDPPAYHLKDFIMAFTLTSGTSTFKSLTVGKHYLLSATQLTMNFVTKDGEVNLELGNEDLPIEPCSEEYFGDLLDQFQTIANIDDLYCIPKESVYLFVKGKLGAVSMSELNIFAFPCVGLDTCADAGELAAELTNTMIIMYYADSFVDLQSYENPVKISRAGVTDTFNLNSQHETLILLTPWELTTDDGWLFSSESTRKGIKVQSTTRGVNTASDPFYRFTLRLSDTKIVYTRSYKKVQDGLAEIMGVASTVALAIALLLSPYFEIKVYEGLVNQVYAKEPKFEKINFTVWDFVKAKFLRSKTAKAKLKNLDDRIDRVNRRLDISRIVRNMLTLEKMRAVLFDEYQDIVFDHVVETSSSQSKVNPYTIEDFEIVKHETLLPAIEAVKKRGKTDAIDGNLQKIYDKSV